jgi:hypothetical protein
MSEAPAEQRWRILFTPRWLGWHLFAVLAFIGMLWLGDWQLHRALSGNSLSWAYTFEWPIFAVFGVVFWTKTVRDELHPRPDADSEPEEISLPAGARRPGVQATAGAAADGAGVGLASNGHAGAAFTASANQAGRDGAGTGDGHTDVDSTGPQDEELAEYNAYLAKLNAEVKRHGRWHGLR